MLFRSEEGPRGKTARGAVVRRPAQMIARQFDAGGNMKTDKRVNAGCAVMALGEDRGASSVLRRTRHALTALMVAGAAALPWTAQAQSYPVKPIRMVVTAAAGGITDIMTRIMSENIARTLGQPMIVENRPGAGEIGRAHV